MSTPPRKNPFVGPRALKSGENLYGRERETNQLVNLLIADRVVVLHSPSGAGKTSLIQAALIPRLQARQFSVLPVLRVNLDSDPATPRPPSFNRYIYSALVSLEEARPESQRLPEAELIAMRLATYLDRLYAANDDQSLVLIFDQFEEILTLDPTDHDARLEFFEQLGEALQPRTRWALFALREDYLAGLEAYALPVPTRFANTFRLDLLNRQAARQVIQSTTSQEGVAFTDEAADKLIDDLSKVQVQRLDGTFAVQAGQYVEPVQLQVVCHHIWEELPPGDNEVSTDEIEAVGDVDHSLAAYYALQVAAAAASTGVADKDRPKERRIREWFERALISEGGVRNQVLMTPEQSQGLENEIIRRLENAHLVRAERRRGATWFELSHDRLVGPVRNDNAAWFQANLSLLQRQAALWQSQNQAAHLLLRAQALQEAEKWAAEHESELIKNERAFLEACQEVHRQEELQRQRIEQDIKLREQSRQANRLRFLFALAMIAAIVATTLGAIAMTTGREAIQASVANATFAAENAQIAATNQSNAAEAQAASTEANIQQVIADLARGTAEVASTAALAQQKIAEQNAAAAAANEEAAKAQAAIALSRQLAAQAVGYLDTQTDLSALLSIEAYRASDTVEANSAMLSTLQRGLQMTFQRVGRRPPQEPGNLLSVSLSPDGERLAWGDEQGNVAIWNYQKGELERRLAVHKQPVFGLDFSPDSKTLASAGEEGTIVLIDVQTGALDHFTGAVSFIESLAFSPDGKRLAATVGTQVSIWDVSTRKRLVDLRYHSDDVESVAWSRDGRWLASCGKDRRVIVWNAETGERVANFRGHTGTVYSVAWSDDGKTLASASSDGTLRLWDVQSGEALTEPIQAHGGQAIYAVAFSYDGSILASGGADNAILLTDSKTFAPIGRLPDYHYNVVRALDFFPKKGPMLLASASYDNTVGLHQILPQQPLKYEISSNKGEILAIAPLEGGEYRLAGQSKDKLTAWQLTDQVERRLFELPGPFSSAAYSWDGAIMALAEEQGNIDLYDAISGKLLYTLNSVLERADAAFSLAFSQDGKQLASAHCAQPVPQSDPPACLDAQVYLWQVGSDEPPRLLLSRATDIVAAPTFNHSDYILSLAFSPDDARLASGSRDLSILIWNVQTGLAPVLPFTRHENDVTSLAFDSQRGWLASGGADGQLFLWDVETGQTIDDLLVGVQHALLSLAFSSDGRTLYSGDANGSLLSWDVALDSWITRLCTLAGRNLSQAEWAQFLPGQPYRKTCEQYPEGDKY